MIQVALATALALAPSPLPSPAPASGYVTTETGRLFYETAGQGEAVVLIHDGLVHRETWDDQFAVLARRFRVVRYDRRGFGRSDVPSAPFSNVDDLDDVITTLALGKVALVGCSAGGGLAIDYTLQHPERVTRLVLVGAVVSGLPASEHFKDRGGHRPADLYKDVARDAAYWSTEDPYFVSASSPGARQRVKALLTANPQNLRVPYPLLRGPRVPALGRLGEIKAPTLLVIGAEDIPDVHAHAGAIQAGIPGARRVVIRSAGHLVHMERPEEFNRLVLEFLGGPPAP
jgi:pimeloyl-ACP methyl ester carboxylesterase